MATKTGKALAAVLVLVFGVIGAGAYTLVCHGISARDKPTAIETVVARALRRLATPSALRAARNPVAATPANLARARAHFADHCATCHGNDGRGRTAIGQSLYPKAPDMQGVATQSLTDGEIFAIIKYGVRLTGMPAWGQDTTEDDEEAWRLVHFIRHLPSLTADELAEMESLNPRSRKELEDEQAVREFLAGGAAPEPPAGHAH